MSKKSEGVISQIIGPVVDVTFEKGNSLPDIFDALEVTREDGHKIVFETQQDIGENTIRSVAMDSTDGLRRGMKSSCATDLHRSEKGGLPGRRWRESAFGFSSGMRCERGLLPASTATSLSGS